MLPQSSVFVLKIQKTLQFNILLQAARRRGGAPAISALHTNDATCQTYLCLGRPKNNCLPVSTIFHKPSLPGCPGRVGPLSPRLHRRYNFGSLSRTCCNRNMTGPQAAAGAADCSFRGALCHLLN